MNKIDPQRAAAFVVVFSIVGGLINNTQNRSVNTPNVVSNQQVPPIVVPAPKPYVAPSPPPAPVAPVYNTIPINQWNWSAPVVVRPGWHLTWRPGNPDLWLDTRINKSQEYRSPPLNDTRWSPIDIREVIETIEFRVTRDTPVKSGIVQCAMVAVDVADIPLPDTQPPITKHVSWPGEDRPTRELVLPPPDYVLGNVVTDTIDPIEDVYYRITPGWKFKPNPDGRENLLQFAALHGRFKAHTYDDCDGARIRVSDPGADSVTMHFVFERAGGTGSSASTFVPKAPVMRQIPLGNPTYYPSSSPQQRRQAPNSSPTYYRSSPSQPPHQP